MPGSSFRFVSCLVPYSAVQGGGAWNFCLVGMAAGPTRYLRFIQRRGPFIGIGILFGAVGKTIVDRLKGEVYIRHDEDSREHIVAEDVVFVGDEYGLPVGNDVLKYENHTICYDRSRKTPSWVLQRLNKNTINGDGERQLSAFKMDPNIPLRFSAFSDDYQKSGYSRGHMASAGIYSYFKICSFYRIHIGLMLVRPLPLETSMECKIVVHQTAKLSMISVHQWL